MTLTRAVAPLAADARTTVYADNPPFPLVPVTFANVTGVTNERAALQAQLDYVKTTFGGGRVVLAAPGKTCRIAAGITIPAKVQLWMDGATFLDAADMTTGTAITVNDSDFTPLVGVRLDGGLYNPTTSDLASTYTGISVTGVNLVFEQVHVQYFGRGIDLAHTSTFLCTFRDAGIGRCATGLYVDIEAAGATNAGENIRVIDSAIANCVRGFNATANGLHLRFDNTSLDFCTLEIGRVLNAHVHVSGHIETSTAYVFDVSGNSVMFFTGCEFVLGQAIMFKSGIGPATVGFGGARFKDCMAFFTDNTSASNNVRSEHTFLFPTGTTTLTMYVPWPLKWTPITCAPVFLDGNAPTAGDEFRVTSQTSAIGQINLVANRSEATVQRAVMLRFG